MSKTMFELDEWVVNTNHIVAVRKYPDNKGDLGSIDVYLSTTPPNAKMLEGPIHYAGHAAKAVLEHLRFTHIARSLTSRVKALQDADKLAQDQDNIPTHLRDQHMTVEEARQWIATTFMLLSEFQMRFLDSDIDLANGQEMVFMRLPGMEEDGPRWMTLDAAAQAVHDLIHAMLEEAQG